MGVEIITQTLQLDIYGFGGIATNKDYAGTAFKLSGRMWEFVKANNLRNKGKNIWVYDSAEKVFAGVELYKSSDDNHGLEPMTEQGYEVKLPYIEIYGHWTSDDTKLETELLMCLV